jgi:curved DNA-binding protein CbpA
MDPHRVLGVEPGASPGEIARAYRRAAWTTHPDRRGGSAERFHAVVEAYETLRMPAARELEARVPPAPAPGHIVLGARRPVAAEPDALALFRLALAYLRDAR